MKRRIHKVEKPKKVKSREYPLNERCIIGYKKPRGMSDKDFSKFIDRAAADVLARFGISTIVVGVSDWNELRILDETIMEKYGWVKKDTVFMFKDDLDLERFSEEEIQQLVDGFGLDEEE